MSEMGSAGVIVTILALTLTNFLQTKWLKNLQREIDALKKDREQAS